MKKLAIVIIALSSVLGMTKTDAQVAVGVSIGIAPPELPVYEQPPCPTDGYMWSPGYWAYGPPGYYWVPGVWVAPPEIGFLWTPGYWGYGDGGYFWNGGYWGTSIGFYGGVCYGYGYGGHGFYGGRWQGGRFQYNTAAWHVGGGIHNTYVDRTVINNNSNRSSFNGRGGIQDQPNATEQSVAKQNHIQPTSAQQSHQQKASTSKNQLASVNHGNPATTARSTVGGDRFNSAGHSISTVHAANINRTGPANHMSKPVASHSPTPSHTNTQGPQQHQNIVQNRPAQPQHSAIQNRPAAPQHQSSMQNRPAPQQQSRPSGGQGGGQRPQEGGGGRH
jgi:hypothetical protein